MPDRSAPVASAHAGHDRPHRALSTVEAFPSHTSVTFDPVATAESAARPHSRRPLQSRARQSPRPVPRPRHLRSPRSMTSLTPRSHADGSCAPLAAACPPLIGIAVKARIVEALFRLAAQHRHNFSRPRRGLLQNSTPSPQAATRRRRRPRNPGAASEPSSASRRSSRHCRSLSAPPGAPIGDDDGDELLAKSRHSLQPEKRVAEGNADNSG